VTGVNADVRGREVVIYDDMIRTGATRPKVARDRRAGDNG
jgi:ribose-phosphate pyrophosphokinase